MGVAVDLHIWRLDPPEDPDADIALLSADETARMARFVYDKHRTAYLAARAGLRRHLGAIMDHPPGELVFTYGPQGKPALPGGPAFNLSHAGDLACLAVHPTCDLGVDIEAFRDIEEGLAERFFAPGEISALQAMPATAQDAGFFRCWTRKEAVIKALGGGLSIPLDAFDVTLDANRAALIRLEPDYGQASDWALHPFGLGPQMVGAVAAKTGGTPITLTLRNAPDDLPFDA